MQVSILLRICYNKLMDTVKVLKVSDISAINLDKLVDSEKSLFVSATRSLNYQIRKKNKVEVYDFTQIQNMLNEQIREKDCLTESQMKYILFKTIDKMTDETIKQAFKNSLSEIYDLFSNLLYAEVDKADVKLDTIKNKNVRLTHFETSRKKQRNFMRRSKVPFYINFKIIRLILKILKIH